MAAALLLAAAVAGNLSGMVDQWLSTIAERYFAERKQSIEQIQTPAQLRARQIYVRRTILESLGGWPEKTPLNAKITGSFERDAYRVEKLVYESLPGFRVTANVYVPTKFTPPFPAVLGVAGHSNEGKAIEIYQRGFIGMVRRGWLVIAFDPPGQGERSLYWDASAGKSKVGIGTKEHTMAGLQCLLTGSNIARYETWDGIRAVDYLLTRPDVDPKRIGVAGNSGGGTQSAYLAALEPRLAVAAPSCYITSWTKLWYKPGPQDAEQNMHGFIAAGLDFPDFLTAYAPRPIKMMTAIKDFFPIDGARATFQEATALFEVAGARDKVDFFEYDDGHGWSKPRREATYRWFERHLNHREDDGLEPEFSVEKPEALNVTSTGQLATSLGSETVQSLNARQAEQMYGSRESAMPGANIPAIVRARLAVHRAEGAVIAKPLGETGRDGYRIERLTLQTEPGITVPAMLYLPARRGSSKLSATVLIDPRGKDAADNEAAALALKGQAVMAIDPRGYGESAPPKSISGGYGADYQTFMRAYLLGRTMAGLQTFDVLRTVDYMSTRPEIDAQKISVSGSGNAGVLSIYAGVLDRRIQRVTSRNALESYLWLAKQPVHDGYLELFVPGVLQSFDIPDLIRYLGDRYAR